MTSSVTGCSTCTIALKTLDEAFGVKKVFAVSLQALSGAGYPGVPSLDIMDNIIPNVANGGEEEKVELEPRKMLGKYTETLKPPSPAVSHGDASYGTPSGAFIELAHIKFSVHTNRVAVIDGHTVCASVELSKQASAEEAEAVLREYRAPASASDLPSSPRPVIEVRNEADRPQPRLDRLTGKGMSTVVGRVRRDPILDLKLSSCRTTPSAVPPGIDLQCGVVGE